MKEETEEVMEDGASEDLEHKDCSVKCESLLNPVESGELIEDVVCKDLENKDGSNELESLQPILESKELIEDSVCKDLENKDVSNELESLQPILESKELIEDSACKDLENKDVSVELESLQPILESKEVIEDSACKDLEYKDFSVELEGFPHIFEYIQKLQEEIKVQKNAIIKSSSTLETKEIQCDLPDRHFVDNQTQTDLSGNKSTQDWVISDSKEAGSLADQVKEAAESAVLQTGFVYEKTTGLYYHYESGYYYDPKSGLYYDGNNGAYYYYDDSTKSYKFHSQVARDSSEPMDTSADNPATKKEKSTTEKEKSTTKKEQSDRKKNKVQSDINDLIAGLSTISIQRSRQNALGNNFESLISTCILPYRVGPKKIKLSKELEEPEVIEVEEGECSDSDGSSSSSVEIITIGSPENNNEDVSRDYPPCMRIIVQETNIPKLKIGTLFLVTCTGGSIGREGDHPVLIRDINISKHHAKLQYNEENKAYEIIDLGSRNGTVVNGKRISAAKQESEAIAIVHGATIQLGSTKLLCHIHKGNETCGHCEPGLLQTTVISAEPTYRSTKAEYESELKRIKNKFGLKEDNTETSSRVATGYQDRAKTRRNNVGSSCQFAKTQQSSLTESIPKDNPGFKMLAKMGWTEGTSLGKSNTGLTEPVPLLQKVDKAGLGADSQVCENVGMKKQVIWKKTQQRYDEIKTVDE